jgi:hypothetical protein
MAGIECRVSSAHALLNLIEQGHLLSGWSARLELSLVCSWSFGVLFTSEFQKQE